MAYYHIISNSQDQWTDRNKRRLCSVHDHDQLCVYLERIQYQQLHQDAHRQLAQKKRWWLAHDSLLGSQGPRHWWPQCQWYALLIHSLRHDTKTLSIYSMQSSPCSIPRDYGLLFGLVFLTSFSEIWLWEESDGSDGPIVPVTVLTELLTVRWHQSGSVHHRTKPCQCHISLTIKS